MEKTFQNVFSDDYINYLLQLPEVINAREKINNSNSIKAVYFTIPMTDTIKNALFETFNLNMQEITQIPMRWIKGDTTPHIDVGPTQFENTYLIYLNDSPGELILDTTSYPILKNTGFMFSEGLPHETINTGTIPRLLMGPMNELADPVGAPILYYPSLQDAIDESNILGGSLYTFESQGGYTSWIIYYSSIDETPPAGVFNVGDTLFNNGSNNYYKVYPYIGDPPCFKKDTKILCLVNDEEKYVPIQNIKNGDLVKTFKNGYLKVDMIGRGHIYNSGDNVRTRQRLFKYTQKTKPCLTEDLIITGSHSILVKKLTDEQIEKSIDLFSKVNRTGKHYRLASAIDENAIPYEIKGMFEIWHLALENSNDLKNYGIYANGLLVESCSKRYIKDLEQKGI